MRPGPNSKRPRNHRNNARRGGGGGGQGGRSGTYDSNGPDVKIRGNPNQIYDKYIVLARDATSSGDRVMAENYLQHAEHYFRIINENNSNQRQQQGHGQGHGQHQGQHQQGGQHQPQQQDQPDAAEAEEAQPAAAEAEEAQPAAEAPRDPANEPQPTVD